MLLTQGDYNLNEMFPHREVSSTWKHANSYSQVLRSLRGEVDSDVKAAIFSPATSVVKDCGLKVVQRLMTNIRIKITVSVVS